MDTKLNQKLDKENNTFLSLKCFLLSSEDLINKCKKYLESKGYKIYILKDNDLYNDIQKSFNYDYVFYQTNIDILNPLCVIIDNYDESLIKGFIDTYYYSTDNGLENRLLKQARKVYSNIMKIKTDDELFAIIDKYR